MHECVTWSHTLTEEYRPRVLEKRVLGKMFGSTRDEGKGKLEEFEACTSL